MSGLIGDADPLSIHSMSMGGKVVWTRVRYLIDGLKDLPEAERVEVLAHFCKGCGDFDPDHKCCCMADW